MVCHVTEVTNQNPAIGMLFIPLGLKARIRRRLEVDGEGEGEGEVMEGGEGEGEEEVMEGGEGGEGEGEEEGGTEEGIEETGKAAHRVKEVAETEEGEMEAPITDARGVTWKPNHPQALLLLTLRTPAVNRQWAGGTRGREGGGGILSHHDMYCTWT